MINFYNEQKERLRISKNRHILFLFILVFIVALLYYAFLSAYGALVVNNNYETMEKINEIYENSNQQSDRASETHEKSNEDINRLEKDDSSLAIDVLLRGSELNNQSIYNFISLSISGISIVFSILGSAILLQIYNIKKAMQEYDEKIISYRESQ